MIIELLLPCLILIGIGLTSISIIRKFIKIRMSIVEISIFSLVLGCGILIIPWVFMGLQYHNYLFQKWPLILSVYSLAGIILLSFINFKKIFINLQQYIERFVSYYDYEVNKIYFKKSIVLFALIMFLIFDLAFYQLLLPLRGYDAIWLYIPDALWYYQVNEMPIFDLFNFRPTIKEPAHTLLFTFSLYINGDFYIQLIPIMFFIVWAMIVYTWVKLLSNDLNKSLFAVLLFLASPFTNWLINFWSYYQDIYVGFFYTATLYCLYKASYTKLSKSEELFFVFIGGVSFALSVLAKMNGWTLIILIILLLPWKNKARIIPSIELIIVSILLFLVATGNVYIGLGIFVLICTVIILVLLWKYNPDKNTKMTLSLLIIPVGIISGLYWLLELFNRFPWAGQGIIASYTYFNPGILWNFPIKLLTDPSYQVESAESASFWGLILFLLVGNIFVFLWAFPKLRAFFDKESRFFSIWILSFFIIWVVYYGSTSIRYLTPIFVPIIILVTNGVYLLYNDIKKRIASENGIDMPIWVFLFVAFCSITSYYFPISPDLILQLISKPNINILITRTGFLGSAYFYYSNALYFTLFIILVSYTIYIILIKDYRMIYTKIRKIHISKKLEMIFYFVAIVGIIIAPIIAPVIIFINNGESIQGLQTNWVYEDRPAYKDILNHLIETNDPFSSIIVVSMPGLGYQLKQPVLDLNNAIGLVKPLFGTNITWGLYYLEHPLEVLQDQLGKAQFPVPNELTIPPFNYIVIPSYGEKDYNGFGNGLYAQSFLFPLLYNPHLFKLIYENSDYRLFERIYTSYVYQGLIDIKLTTLNDAVSILGQIQKETYFSTIPNIEFSFDFTSLHTNYINSTLHLAFQNSTGSFITTDTIINHIVDSSDFTKLDFQLNSSQIINDPYSLSIKNLTLQYSYYNGYQYIQQSYIAVMGQRNTPILDYQGDSSMWAVTLGQGLNFI